jgi:NAD(P)-dependent dehydrogenase (short-subunit alcohol dehydrogenase family)
MLARKRGAIVNIASITAERAVPLHAYAPAKAPVVSITQCLAAEWGQDQAYALMLYRRVIRWRLRHFRRRSIGRIEIPSALCSQAAIGRACPGVRGREGGGISSF